MVIMVAVLTLNLPADLPNVHQFLNCLCVHQRQRVPVYHLAHDVLMELHERSLRIDLEKTCNGSFAGRF